MSAEFLRKPLLHVVIPSFMIDKTVNAIYKQEDQHEKNAKKGKAQGHAANL